MHISGSLLAADFAGLGNEVRRGERAGLDSYHLDVADGHYAPNIALSPLHLAALRPHTSLPFHIHLKVDNPEDVLQRFRPWHADRIILCRDTLSDLLPLIEWIRSRGSRPGLSLNAGDSLHASRALLPALDLLVILAVNAGFEGRAMQPGTVARVAQARRVRDELGLGFEIGVDGGVTGANAADLIGAGADMLIVGTALFAQRSMRRFVRQLSAAGSA